MLKSNYLRNISRALLPVFAAQILNTALPSTSYAKSKEKPTIASMITTYGATSDPVERMLDSLILYHWQELPKNQQDPQDWVKGFHGEDPKFGAGTAIERYIQVNQKKKKKVIPKQRFDVLSAFGDSKFFKEQKPIKATIPLGQPVPDTQEVAKKLDEMYKVSGRDDVSPPKRAQPQRKPVRIVKRDTKLSLTEGELPPGTYIKTTPDNVDFLMAPMRSYNSAWDQIVTLRLAPANNDSISDLLAAALPPVRQNMNELGISETMMRRFETDTLKVVGGRTLIGKDGLPLDITYKSDILPWQAQVLEKRGYEYVPPEVREKAKEQLEEKVAPDTTKYVPIPTPPEPPKPIIPTTRIVQVERKGGTPLWCKIGIGVGLGALAYAILKGEEEKRPRPQKPTGEYEDDPQPGVHSPKIKIKF